MFRGQFFKHPVLDFFLSSQVIGCAIPQYRFKIDLVIYKNDYIYIIYDIIYIYLYVCMYVYIYMYIYIYIS